MLLVLCFYSCNSSRHSSYSQELSRNVSCFLNSHHICYRTTESHYFYSIFQRLILHAHPCIDLGMHFMTTCVWRHFETILWIMCLFFLVVFVFANCTDFKPMFLQFRHVCFASGVNFNCDGFKLKWFLRTTNVTKFV